jgi:hypothetical protein
MAGDWIKMRVDLHDDPAVIALSHALKLDEFAVVGRLHKLWAWGDRHMVDGYAAGVSAQWIDRYVGCKGFARRLLAVGWLERADGGIAFPRFDRHNGESAKQRVVATERKRNLRARPEAPAGLSHPQRDRSADNSATREEKKREENSKPTPIKPLRTPLPADFALSDQVKAWAEARGTTNLQAHFDFFVRKANANGYTYVNWDRALENAVIDDWAKLNTGAALPKRVRTPARSPGAHRGSTTSIIRKE